MRKAPHFSEVASRERFVRDNLPPRRADSKAHIRRSDEAARVELFAMCASCNRKTKIVARQRRECTATFRTRLSYPVRKLAVRREKSSIFACNTPNRNINSTTYKFSNLMNVIKQALCTLLFGAFALGLSADSPQWRKGALYRLSPPTAGAKVLDVRDDAVRTAEVDAARREQYWTLAPLSGAWRIINPFTHARCVSPATALKPAKSTVRTRTKCGASKRRREEATSSCRLLAARCA